MIVKEIRCSMLRLRIIAALGMIHALGVEIIWE